MAREANHRITMKKPSQPIRQSQAGFSLAEMMVVIVIIGLLATLVVPNVLRNLGKAYETTAKVNIKSLDQAVQEYAMDHGGNFPDSLEELIEKDENGRAYLKLEELPKDPWGLEYLYDPATDGDNYRIYTLGKDGQPGGEGENADMDQISILKKK